MKTKQQIIKKTIKRIAKDNGLGKYSTARMIGSDEASFEQVLKLAELLGYEIEIKATPKPGLIQRYEPFFEDTFQEDDPFEFPNRDGGYVEVDSKDCTLFRCWEPEKVCHKVYSDEVKPGFWAYYIGYTEGGKVRLVHADEVWVFGETLQDYLRDFPMSETWAKDTSVQVEE